jgi:hypothetical protein
MRESYVEGLATHSGPESCGDPHKGMVGGVRAGRVLSRERSLVRDADAAGIVGRHHRAHRQREMRTGPARSQTPCTYGNTSHENREVLGSPATDAVAGRVGKSKDARRR